MSLGVLISFSAKSLTITESAGWIESAYVKWQAVAGATQYNVYISGNGITNRKADTQLIRNYGSYYRADIPGLQAGNYSIRVVALTDNTATEEASTTEFTVQSHDRSGFAFANNRVPGAYQADGTLKANAVIIYVTEKTKNTVSLEVTGANANPCVGLQNILDGFKKGKDSRPLIVRIIGQITDLSYMLGGDVVVENSNNAASFITIEGIGNDAVADGWGIRVKNASNVEIRNLGFMNCDSSEGDNIGLQQDNDYIWVHHCDLFYGNAGSDADQIKGDGALDCKKSTYITFSYNHFWDSGKCNLLGLSEGTTTGLYITYHHNWYDHSDSRHPRVRYYSAHVYNNYYDGNAKYGAGSTLGSSVFMEANYFRNCKYPMLTSMQGSDVWDESKQANDYTNMPTFSKENGGTIKAFNNFMSGQHRFVAYGAAGYTNSTTVDFDAYVASSRAETVPATVKSAYGANAYNNFDTNEALMYAYTPDSPEAAKAQVMQYAGRVNGGDLKWTFDNATDDASYAVNTALKTAISGYKTSLVSVQGEENTDTGSGETGGGETGGGETSADMIHNFSLSGKTSTFYTITGNLSDSKGTVVYQDITMTQCLKMESSTIITFTTTSTARLTLVFNSDFTGKIKINDISYTAANGIVTTTLAAGTHKITKGDSSNLYYISTAYVSTGVDNPEAISVKIYPNPATNQLRLEAPTAIHKVEIYNLGGKLLQTVIGNISSINLNHLSAGSYLVKVHTVSDISTQLIMKK